MLEKLTEGPARAVALPALPFSAKAGPWRTCGVVGVVLALGMVGLIRIRRFLLATEFGTSYLLMGLGVLCLMVASRLREPRFTSR